jgi:hypothetical protein
MATKHERRNYDSVFKHAPSRDDTFTSLITGLTEDTASTKIYLM